MKTTEAIERASRLIALGARGGEYVALVAHTMSAARAGKLTALTDSELADCCELEAAGHEDRRAELAEAEQVARAAHEPGEALWIYWSRRWCCVVLILTTIEGQSYLVAESGL